MFSNDVRVRRTARGQRREPMQKRLPQFLAGALSVAALTAAAPMLAHAQDWRTISTSRDRNGEDRLSVDVQYGAGTLRIAPGPAQTLYRASLRYDAESFKPVTSYEDGKLRVGIDGGRIRGRNMKPARLDLSLGNAVPLELDLKFGAAEADLELGGLRIRELSVSTGASATKVRIAQANPERCAHATFEVGAASFEALNLGNLNCEKYRLNGGVGEVTLDFTGDLRTNSSLDVEMGLGSLTLRVPRGMGLSVRKSGVLAAFDSQELVKRGNVYESEGYDRSKRKLGINIDAALGAIRVQWVDN